MSRKIYGVTVGTTISPKHLEKRLKPVKTVNDVEPDENGNVQVGGSADAVQANLDAHTGNKKNPHGVTAGQVGARPNTWMPTAEEVGARPNTWMPSVEDVGAAPGGYGLGTAKDFTADQLDSLTKPGFYSSDNEMTIGGHTSSRWWMYVSAYGPGTSFATQRMMTFSSGKGYTLERHKVNGTWGEWGWVNPPLEQGKEYRTTETQNGKSVWAVRFLVGNMVAGGVLLQTEFKATGISRFFGECNGFSAPIIWNADLANQYTLIPQVYLSNSAIKVIINGGSQYYNKPVYLTVWYTKD